MQIYNENEKAEQKEVQNVLFEEKERTRKFNVGPWFVLKEKEK